MLCASERLSTEYVPFAIAALSAATLSARISDASATESRAAESARASSDSETLSAGRAAPEVEDAFAAAEELLRSAAMARRLMDCELTWEIDMSSGRSMVKISRNLKGQDVTRALQPGSPS